MTTLDQTAAPLAGMTVRWIGTEIIGRVVSVDSEWVGVPKALIQWNDGTSSRSPLAILERVGHFTGSVRTDAPVVGRLTNAAGVDVDVAGLLAYGPHPSRALAAAILPAVNARLEFSGLYLEADGDIRATAADHSAHPEALVVELIADAVEDELARVEDELAPITAESAAIRAAAAAAGFRSQRNYRRDELDNAARRLSNELAVLRNIAL